VSEAPDDLTESRLGDFSAPLDALLVDAASGSVHRFLPGRESAAFTRSLARRPLSVASELLSLAAELTRVAAGTSGLEPETRDRRYADQAWRGNPVLHRAVQAHLACAAAAHRVVDLAELDTDTAARMRFLVENAVDATAPSNNPLLNPAALKEAIDTGGVSFARGLRNALGDLTSAPRVPSMVDTEPFSVGENLAVTPGSVVLETPVLELIQYRPQTAKVSSVPLLVVPPTINKFYVLDLAPGRSLIEHLVASGQQVFVISWRNPLAQHSDWGLDTYVEAVVQALEAVREITDVDAAHLFGACSGGIISSLVAGHLAATGREHELAGLTLAVTVLDQSDAGLARSMVDEGRAEVAIARSKRAGYLDGKALAEVFAWLRPNDLVWNYWVNNYLLGRKPPAFDILYWNADTTRMPAHLHRDFLETALANTLVTPGATSVLGHPVDLGAVKVDTYIVGGVADHITPWQACYRSTQLFGGDTRFVLSTSGHIASLVNPPGNPKASYRTAEDHPVDPQTWHGASHRHEGTWWTDYVAWLGERSGPQRKAPERLGAGRYQPVVDAPGTYVHDK
jgi:polyhydroxyalkanoate synthase